MDKSSDDEKSVSEGDHDGMLQKIGESENAPKVKDKSIKRRKMESAAEITEIQAEGEFNAGISSLPFQYNLLDPSSKLQLADLLGAIEKNTASNQPSISSGKIKKDIKRIAKRAAAVHKPLAKPVRDRIEREASYKKTQVDTNKWVPQIKHNREAECVDYVQEPVVEKSLTGIAAERAHVSNKTKLEKDIMEALKRQGMETEEKIKVIDF